MAIQRCRLKVESDGDVIVDTVMTARKTLGVWTGREKTLEALMRAGQMIQYIQAYRDYAEARDAYPDVTFRYTVVPSQTLPNPGFPFAFKPTDLNAMI